MKTATEYLCDENITNFEKRVIVYAHECHSGTNHRYDNNSYMVHLCHVRDVAERYKHLIHENKFALSACWTHDLIWDTRQSYNDIKNNCGPVIAELSFALSEDLGRNRKERNSPAYYSRIRDMQYATFVKLCDRIANIEYGIESKSSMVDMYRKEHEKFYDALCVTNEYDEMWKHLNELLFPLPVEPFEI